MSRHLTRPSLPLLNLQRWGRRRALVALLATVGLIVAVVVGAIASHSGSDGRRSATSADPRTATAARVEVTRWWSVPGAARGSRIDPLHPTALAARLTPSRGAYCTVLDQTVSAGKSVLPDVSATSPRLVLATEAFVGELTAVAPGAVQPAWRTLGSAVLALVRSGGALSKVTLPAPAVLGSATNRIAADAKAECHVDLSAAAHK